MVLVIHSIAYAIQYDDPETAHLLAGEDGRITAQVAYKRLKEDTARQSPTEPAARLARAAWRQDSTAVLALSTLALSAQITGNVAKARRLFRLSETMSRRELNAQLWLIEDAVGKGDIAGALVHYDIALRTSVGARRILFPVLSSAIGDPAILTKLTKMLSAGSSWGTWFVEYLAVNSSDSKAAADLYVSLDSSGVAISSGAAANLISRLVATGAYDDAWRVFEAVRGKVDRSRSRDPNFTVDVAIPSVFDWIALDSAGLGASIDPAPGGGSFNFSGASSEGGVILRQGQVLPPGDYILSGHSSVDDQNPISVPFYWTLTCQSGIEVGRLPLTAARQSDGRFAGRITVPARCPFQTLALVAPPSDAAMSLSGQIDKVSLLPAQR